MAAVSAARGSSFIFSKQLLVNMEPLNLLGIRFTLAFAILMLLFGKKAAADIREDRGALGAGVVLGLLYFAVMTLEMNALRLTNAATASFIENSAVVLVPLTEAVIHRCMPERSMLISAGLCLAGIGFLTAEGFNGGVGLGELILIISACIYTAAVIVTDRQAKKHDPFTVGIVYVGTIGICGLLGALMTETPQLPKGPEEWMMLLMLTIVCSCFGFAMQPVAQRTLSSETTGILTAINPLTTTVLGSIVLNERFGITGMMGAGLIIGGIMIHNFCPYMKKRSVS